MDASRVTDTMNIEQLRADTRGCTGITHLNNAGSALPPAVVTDTVVDFLTREEMMGGYEAHSEAQDHFAAVYTSIGNLINAPAHNIAITTSATDSWDRAFSAVHFSHGFTEKSRFLVSASEYASNVLPLMQVAARTGASVEFIPDNENGVTCPDALAQMLDDNVAVVSINHCPSHNGLINDVSAIGAVIRANAPEAWYFVDACQSAGQLPVDVATMNADFVSATGRKFLRGPRGTGFLYASDRALTDLEPFPIDLHAGLWTHEGYEVRDGAYRFESWEKPYAAILGLGAAVDYALALGQESITERIQGLASYARTQLETLDDIRVLDRGIEKSGIVTFVDGRRSPREIVAGLRLIGINTSMGTGDYARVDYDSMGIDSLVRVSPHVYNTVEEIDNLVKIVDSLAN